MPSSRFQFRLIFALVATVALLFAFRGWLLRILGMYRDFLKLVLHDWLDLMQPGLKRGDGWVIWTMAAGYAVCGLATTLAIWWQCRRRRLGQ